MPFNNLAEIWSYYDIKDRKHFDARDICAAINPLRDGPEQEYCGYELLAFSFVPNRNRNLKGLFYYNPYISISSDAISYWEYRAAIVVNPLLKLRYTGLVSSFKKQVTGIIPDYETIKLANIEALIEVVDGDYCKDQLLTIDYAELAIKLAIGFRNEDLQQRAVEAFFNAHTRIDAQDSSAGLWGPIVHSLIKYRKVFASYEKEIIQENLDRLNRVEALALEEGCTTDSHVHTMAQQVDLLCEYYHSIGKDAEIEGLLDRLLIAIRLSIPLRGGMWGQSMLESMQQRFRKYGFDKKANHLYTDLCNLGSQTISEMAKVEGSFQVKREDINQFINYFIDGSLADALNKYIFHFIPNKEQEIKRQQEMAKEHPLLDMISTVNIDAMGNALNKIGVGEKAQEQKLHYSMYEGISVSSVFMQIVMDELIEKKHLTVESLMNMFESCPLVNDDRRVFLERGFYAYLQGNDIACSHILVPQFEALIRTLVYINGGEILRPAKDPAVGNEYQSLESLLDSPAAKTALSEDIVEYFKVLFVSQAGWNIRNSISHGLFPSRNFSRTMSDRIVHALLVLSRIGYVEDAAQPSI